MSATRPPLHRPQHDGTTACSVPRYYLSTNHLNVRTLIKTSIRREPESQASNEALNPRPLRASLDRCASTPRGIHVTQTICELNDHGFIYDAYEQLQTAQPVQTPCNPKQGEMGCLLL